VMPNIWKHLVSVKLSAFIFEFHLMCGYLWNFGMEWDFCTFCV
jgi:hypothetical protein